MTQLDLSSIRPNHTNSNSLKCHHCDSRHIVKAGKCPRTGKQKYRCQSCKRVFHENPIKVSSSNYLPKDITPQEMFHYDLWDIRVLGKQAAVNGQYSLNFSDISLDWLKSAAKKWLWYRVVSNEMPTLQRKLETIKAFEYVISSNFSSLQPHQINRQTIQEFIIYLSSKGNRPKTTGGLIGNLRQFLEDCKRFNWINIPKEAIVFDDDFPKENKYLPRFIPDDVLKQIDTHLSSLAQPVALVVNILRETGVRSSEVVSLKFNCLRQDSTGTYWITVQQRKMKKEISLCISKELAKAITEQQQYITQSLSKEFPYLFCLTKNHSWFRMYGTDKHHLLPRKLSDFEPIPQPMNTATLRGYFYWFAQENQIKDSSGNVFPLWRLHGFRHTHGTELINNGVPQHIVQKRLGHASPTMTSVYAHIHDQTMKQEMDKFWDGRVVNIDGELIASHNPDLDTTEMQWIKKNMKAQALPNGFCGLPIRMDCPVQGSPCLTCSHFRTTAEYIETHKTQLENTEKIIEHAKAQGWERQVKTNEPIAENLKNIIQGLEGGSAHA